MRIFSSRTVLIPTSTMIIATAGYLGLPHLYKLEGNVLHSYKDVVGVWTGCAGITKNMKAGLKFTDEDCKVMNSKEFEKYLNHVYSRTEMKNPELLSAHGLFTYNIGMAGYDRSMVLREYKKGNFEKSCHAMMNWNGLTHNGIKYNCNRPENSKVKGCKGIVNRRKQEVDYCLASLQCDIECQVQKMLAVGR